MAVEITLTPNLVEAQTFLDILDPGAKFTFQVICEAPKLAKKTASLYHGHLQELAEGFTQLNNVGTGIFVMVNEGDLKGRKTENVVRVRANFVDIDNASLDPVMHARLPPHIVVESSPGKGHGYWLVDDCPLTEFKARQHALARRFGGDTAVCDLPRVMRLPGFWHVKTVTPFLTHLLKPLV